MRPRSIIAPFVVAAVVAISVVATPASALTAAPARTAPAPVHALRVGPDGGGVATGTYLAGGRTLLGVDRAPTGLRRLPAAPAPAPHAAAQTTLDVRVRTATGVTPDATVVFVVNTDDSTLYNRGFQISGTDRQLVVPPGHYTVMADAISAPAGTGEPEIDRFAFATDVEVTRGNTTTAVLDTARAVHSGFPSFDLPRPVEQRRTEDVFYAIYDDQGVLATYFEIPGFFDIDVRAQTIRGGTHGKLASIALSFLTGTSVKHPYTYYLTSAHRNAVIGGERIALADDQLADIHAHYYGDGRRTVGLGGRFPLYPYFDAGEFVLSKLPGAPIVRDEYLYNPPGVQWLSSEDEYTPDDSYEQGLVGLPRAYSAGTQTREDFFRGPLASGAVSAPGIGSPDCQACRTADTMSLGVAPFTDSDPTHVGELFGGEDAPEQHLNVRADGTVLFDGDDAFYGKGSAYFAVPSAPSDFRVTSTWNGSADGAIRSTHATTVWTFHSQAGAGRPAPVEWGCGGGTPGTCAVLPMLTVHVPLPTTLNSTLTPGLSTMIVTVGHVQHALAPPVDGLTVSLGPDGGALVPQAVQPLGAGRFRVTVATPDAAPGTGITVRLATSDGLGATLTQTTRTAYTVAG